MRAFSMIELYNFTQRKLHDILVEIQSKDKKYILGVDEASFIKYMYDKYQVETLEIIQDSEIVNHPQITNQLVNDRVFTDETYVQKVYTFTVMYSFNGSGELFRVRPSRYMHVSYEIDVDVYNQKLSYKFDLTKEDPEEYKKQKQACYNSAFANLGYINDEVFGINNEIQRTIISAFELEKQKYKSENNFFAAINLQVDPSTQSVFTAPVLKKQPIPQPSVTKTVRFSPEPTMDFDMYQDILKVIYDLGRSMERKPALYQKKEEEDIRDYLVSFLETRYLGHTASGETFNRGGKTDIILKYADDGTNLFVAECKFWHGANEFLAAINQLFGRYLTWRDSKVALLMFVTNIDFSGVLNTVRTEVRKHPLFVRENGEHGDSSFSYIFCLPQDKNKHVFFEVIAFHFDKKIVQ